MRSWAAMSNFPSSTLLSKCDNFLLQTHKMATKFKIRNVSRNSLKQAWPTLKQAWVQMLQHSIQGQWVCSYPDGFSLIVVVTFNKMLHVHVNINLVIVIKPTEGLWPLHCVMGDLFKQNLGTWPFINSLNTLPLSGTYIIQSIIFPIHSFFISAYYSSNGWSLS